MRDSVVFLAALGIVSVVCYIVSAKRNADLNWMLGVFRQLNEKHGTNFPTAENQFDDSVMGKALRCIAFDAITRMACIVRGKKYWVVDFDYFRGFQLKWTEVSDFQSGTVEAEDVYMQLKVNDPSCPIIEQEVESLSYGEEWAARLEMYFE